MIGLRDISVTFGSEPVLQNFSLAVEKGEKLVVTGPSGSGKSTLLNVIMGFVLPQQGEVSVNGLPLTPANLLKIRQSISWLPQELAFPIKNNRELFNYLYCFHYNHPAKPDASAVESLLDRMKLPASILEKDTDEISGGQKQRIMLASILHLNRPILLLDEPTSALDRESADIIIGHLLAQPELTLISVTHDPRWVERAQKVVTL